MQSLSPTDDAAAVADLLRFLRRHPRLTVLSGAGCSTRSGIPDYRDEDGNWKHRQPMQFADFVRDDLNRRRYWAQSYAGWQRVSAARPNAAHLAIARLERLGHVQCVITQNVDNLHRLAGSKSVVDLHGVLHRVRCLDCGARRSRARVQEALTAMNPEWVPAVAAYAPDGDASLPRSDFMRFNVPSCDACRGVLKPDVVFFGESIPAVRVARAKGHLEQSDGLLIVGSSLMVFSGYRFARLASESGKPIAIINRGRTRADELAAHRFTRDCASLLSDAVAALAA